MRFVVVVVAEKGRHDGTVQVLLFDETIMRAVADGNELTYRKDIGIGTAIAFRDKVVLSPEYASRWQQ